MVRAMLVAVALLASLASAAFAGAFDHSALDGVLRQTVSSGDGGRSTRIDYAAVKRMNMQLAEYLNRTSGVSRKSFDSWSKADQLAFLINVYNARTIELVLQGYPKIESIKDLGSVLRSPWKKEFFFLLGTERSLDDVEHTLIRGSGRYGDPRIHFAVNCASIGCPALRAEAYSGESLDAQLEDQAVKFLSDRSRNRMKDGALQVSSVFKWYRADFEAGFRGAASLGNFLAFYSVALDLTADETAQLAAGTMPIRYLDYDWKLNSAR